jgi:Holliday junction DNA helicase RuvB
MTRLVSGEPAALDPSDRALRPQTLAEFVGQGAGGLDEDL